jgi:3-deoxy-manno-octulosonate cytidylyltransferase (CMP-KDO synthetase)
LVDALLRETEAEIGTLAGPIDTTEQAANPNIVKAVAEIRPGERYGRALYFTRVAAPHGAGPLLHHIGIYSYRRGALDRFVRLGPAILEQREKLEQLRALANGFHMVVGLVDEVPLGIDTAEDLEQVRMLKQIPHS